VKTFIHKPLEVPLNFDLEVIQAPGCRYYKTPNGLYYPSITSVLGKTPKDFLAKWRKRIGEEEADKILNYAGTLGDSLHSNIEKYLNNTPPSLSGITVHERYMYMGIQPLLNRIDNIIVQEAALYSNILKVAGRTDCIGEFDGELSIIDFKTSRREKQEEWITNYFLQETAYSIMFQEMTGVEVKNIVILMIEYDGTPKVFKKKRKDYVIPLYKLLKETLPGMEYKNEI